MQPPSTLSTSQSGTSNPSKKISGPINSICVLRLSAIGDVVNLIPTVNYLQQQFPNTKITWIVGKAEAQILKYLPFINVVVYDKKTGIAGAIKLWLSLRKHKFDVLLHCQVALRASILSLFIKARYKVGFSLERAYEKQNIFTNLQLDPQQSTHVVDSYLDFVLPFGLVKPETPVWNIEVSDDEMMFAQNYIHPEMFTLVLSPSSSKTRKNWTVENYIALCDWAVNQGWQVIITGSADKNEINLAAAIEQKVHQIENIAGKTTIGQLCAILKSADLVISPDSGPLHIANALGTTVIGLYAYASPLRSGPYYHLDKTVSVYEKNIPSGDIKWGYKPHVEGLMEQITLDEVIHKIDHVLQLEYSQSDLSEEQSFSD